MRIVVFGLSISSAWGNGHATLLRGLFRCLYAAGHEVHFFERDTAYYAPHRDSWSFPYAHLHLYSDWASVVPNARPVLAKADAAIVTSYCPDGRAASDLIMEMQPPRTLFYDMDTPVTLSRLERGEEVPYLPLHGLGEFDLVLSYTGGRALEQMRTRLGARAVEALYGWVDPQNYFPVATADRFLAHLSYLGTYSEDRQPALEQLFLQPARQSADRSFVIGGAMHPDFENWPKNIRYFDHVSPPEHCAFYCSSPLTLNVTRGSMAAMGYCPSGRLFEAAACGTAILSDEWEGLSEFFTPGEEILIARGTDDARDALRLAPVELSRIAKRARERTLACHTAEIRAARLLRLIEDPASGSLADQRELAAKGA